MTRPTDDPRYVWLDVVAAVDYLAAGARPGLTVCSVLAEALTAWMLDRHDVGTRADRALPWDDPDPLRSVLDVALRTVGGPGTVDGAPLAAVLEASLQRWVADMAQQFNEGRAFAHPAPRTGWPAPHIVTVGATEGVPSCVCRGTAAGEC